jgi:serine/threonine protein phosphatase PrpC
MSKKENGSVRAYVANTHIGVFNDTNNDRMSIVTNLQINSKYNQQLQVSFFAIYDGHNGSAYAEYYEIICMYISAKKSTFLTIWWQHSLTYSRRLRAIF